MGEAKKLFERISGGKKLRKDQCLILILAGILLCVISLRWKRKNKVRFIGHEWHYNKKRTYV